jgi:hypothetical protein
MGLAVGLAQAVHDNPVDGVHTYDAAPVAVSTVLLPLHIMAFAPALTTGNGFTVTVTIAVSIHPVAFEPVTIYVVVTVGLAVGLAHAVQDRPVAGVHVYDVAPDAVNAVLPPEHIAVLALTVTFGTPTIVIVTLPVSTQPYISVPVTV